MAASYSFRKALNGYNREDVVYHLEFINTRHNNQLNQCKADLQAMEKELQQLRTRCGALELEKQGYEDQIAQLQDQLDQQRAQQSAVVSRTDEELEAYRRAERLERQAQQRAEQLFEKANGIISDANAGVDASAQRIDTLARDLLQQLEALKQEVSAGKDALKGASAALSALRPEEM